MRAETGLERAGRRMIEALTKNVEEGRATGGYGDPGSAAAEIIAQLANLRRAYIEEVAATEDAVGSIDLTSEDA